MRRAFRYFANEHAAAFVHVNAHGLEISLSILSLHIKRLSRFELELE